MNATRQKQQRHGFTLLELLMVVIIIAILASIALPQYLKATEKARATEALQLLGAIRTSEARYRAASPTDVYTATAADLDMINPLVPITTKYWGIIPAGLVLDATDASLKRAAGAYAGQDIGITHLLGTICGTFTKNVLDPAAPAC